MGCWLCGIRGFCVRTWWIRCCGVLRFMVIFMYNYLKFRGFGFFGDVGW